MELKWNASEESHLRIIPYRLFFNLPLQQDPNHLFTAMHRWITNRESISYNLTMSAQGFSLLQRSPNTLRPLQATTHTKRWESQDIQSSRHISICWIWGRLTCSVQRSPARFALRPPDIRHCEKQVLYDQGIALPAGDVKGVPAVFVSQCRVCAVAQQLLDHGKVSPSAGHHQRSPERGESKWNLPKLAVTLKATTQWDFLNIVNTWDRHTEKNRKE